MKKRKVAALNVKTTFCALVLLLVLTITAGFVTMPDPADAAAVGYQLNAWNQGTWAKGELKGYAELDWVPFRLEVEGYQGSTDPICIRHNYLTNNHGIDYYGYWDAQNFSIINITSGLPGVSDVVYKLTDNVFKVTRDIVTDDSNGGSDLKYCFEVLEPDVLEGLNSGSFAFYWEAQLAGPYQASQWSNGASLHTFRDITDAPGDQDVPINPDQLVGGSICGSKFNDLNGDGVWDNGEPGLADWEITLEFGGSPVATMHTGTGKGGTTLGEYCFTVLPAGTYRVSEVLQAGWTQTMPKPDGYYDITLSREEDVSDKDFGNTTFVATPIIDIVKTVSQDAAMVDQEVTYTYVVSNPGNVDLKNITVIDNELGTITLDVTTLAPGANTTVTVKYTIVEGDKPGPLVNEATAEGHYGQTTVTDKDDASVTINETPTPIINIVKTVSQDAAMVDQEVTYTYVVSNPGNVDLKNITVIDDQLGPITIPGTTLAPGGSMTGTATYTTTIDDLGELTNIATATGYSVVDEAMVEDTDTKTVLVSEKPAPSISIDKVATPDSVYVGDTITYTYTVTNTGDVILNNVSVTDDKLGAVTLLDTTLDPDESTTVTVTHVATIDDVGELTNIAVAAGYPADESDKVQAQDEATVTVSAKSISIVKIANTESLQAGGTITYSYLVTNTGTVTLYNVTVTDDKLVGVEIALAKTTLEPGESTTGTAQYLTTSTDVGTLTNIATVTGEPGDESEAVQAQDDATVTVTSGGGPTPTPARSINVVKIASTTSLHYGGTITYTYTITNTGDVTLENITLNDDRLGDISLGENTTLEPGDSMTVTKQYKTTRDDVGTLTNIATVTGEPTDESGTVRDTDDASVRVTRPSGGGGGGGGGGTTTETEVVIVPETPSANAPAPTPAPTPAPVPVPLPVVVPVVATMAPPELPFTGGNPMAFAYAGFVLAALGTALRRKFR